MRNVDDSALSQGNALVGEGKESAELQQIKIGQEVELEGPPIPTPRLPGAVVVADFIPRRIHRPEDLAWAAGALLGIVLVLALGVRVAVVDQGVTQEVVQAFGDHVRNLLLIPLRLAEGLFLLISPLAIIIALARQRRFDSILEAVATGAVAALLAIGIRLLITHLPAAFGALLSPGGAGGLASVSHIGIVSLIAALTIAGSGASLKVVRYSWYGVWFLLALEVLQGNGTVGTLLLTVLFGRLVGRLARYAFGFDDRRASPAQLVEAVLNVGLVPAKIDRADPGTGNGPLVTWTVSEVRDDPDITYGDIHLPLRATTKDEGDTEVGIHRVNGAALRALSADRRYLLTTVDGRVLVLNVLDPERGFRTTASDLWDRFRLAGASRWTAPTVKASAERVVLTSQTAINAGVRTPNPVALSEASGSVVLIWEPVPESQSFLKYAQGAGSVSDDLLNEIWTQLRAAHKRGVSHRNLDISTILVDRDRSAWIVGWEDGDVGSPILSREIDCAQLIVHLALALGAQRAVQSARNHLSTSELAAAAMATQSAVMPVGLRKAGAKSDLLKEVRSELAQTARTPEEQLEPFKLQRFSPKAVLITLIIVVVFVGVLGSLNIESIGAALRQANPMWIGIAFLIGLTPWLGSAISLQAFSGVKIRLWDATLAQVAAYFVGVAAPAGIGPAGVNLRFLTRQGMPMPVAVATVTLLQVYHFLTTILLLLLVVVISGASVGALSINPMAIVWIVAGVLALVGALVAVLRIRRWVWKRLAPMWDQIAPQLTRVLASPKQMIYAFVGILIVNAGFIGAFGASLAAFGDSLGVGSLSVTFLLSNTAGSVVPTPGGIGPVEAALTAGLTIAGISAAVALSASVLFRLLTFYLQIPIGWAALKYMQKKNLV